MAHLALTRDIWQIAERQIDKIKPDKIVLLENDANMLPKKKSLDEIFRRGYQTMNTILPKASQKTATTNQNVPESVKMLDTYAQRIGLLPMGQVYQRSGSKYIGRSQQITQNGQKFYRPFPQLKQSFLDTPNLIQNFSFRANKAIQKWNQFVSAEAQLADFISKAQTEQGRRELIINFAKTSSTGTDKLKILSSLYFYYIQKKTSQVNVLNLEPTNVEDLKKLLVAKTSINQAYDSVLKVLNFSQQKDMRLYQKIIDYHTYKVKSLEASLTHQQFKEVQNYLSDTRAFVPPQMISIPTVQQSNWFKVLQKQQGKGTDGGIKLITQNWEPGQSWFRPINYLR